MRGETIRHEIQNLSGKPHPWIPVLFPELNLQIADLRQKIQVRATKYIVFQRLLRVLQRQHVFHLVCGKTHIAGQCLVAFCRRYGCRDLSMASARNSLENLYSSCTLLLNTDQHIFTIAFSRQELISAITESLSK